MQAKACVCLKDCLRLKLRINIMRVANNTNEAQKALTYENLRLVSQRSEIQDIFLGQHSIQAQRMRSDLERVARRPFNILITGETGTGKTQMARQIHRMSVRNNKPFVELNCANLPDHLVEAELFGHRKGAFTGADYDRKGLFEEADGGILFLDEIGDIPLMVQNRLLRAIEEKQIKRLGTNHYQSFDVQIIAATSRELSNMVRDGGFRQDLYCRLAVLPVEASPLRERRDDIPEMVNQFLNEAAKVGDGPINGYTIEEDAVALLCTGHYPGNIRSLRNLVYDLTTYIDRAEPISPDLVAAAVAKMSHTPSNDFIPNDKQQQLVPAVASVRSAQSLEALNEESFLRSLSREGDIVLPIELCVLRSGETFKQWTARAKRCSIEATRRSTGGGMQTVAERLGLTRGSLKSHLHRAKRTQKESLFE